MLRSRLVHTESEWWEFYFWLLKRAQEEEVKGPRNLSRVYRDFAAQVHKEADVAILAGQVHRGL